jgi:hypothetical protein
MSQGAQGHSDTEDCNCFAKGKIMVCVHRNFELGVVLHSKTTAAAATCGGGGKSDGGLQYRALSPSCPLHSGQGNHPLRTRRADGTTEIVLPLPYDVAAGQPFYSTDESRFIRCPHMSFEEKVSRRKTWEKYLSVTGAALPPPTAAAVEAAAEMDRIGAENNQLTVVWGAGIKSDSKAGRGHGGGGSSSSFGGRSGALACAPSTAGSSLSDGDSPAVQAAWGLSTAGVDGTNAASGRQFKPVIEAETFADRDSDDENDENDEHIMSSSQNTLVDEYSTAGKTVHPTLTAAEEKSEW